MKTILRGLLTLGLFATSLLAADYNRVPAGQIKGARLSWVSTNSIKVGPGYGEVSGSYWEIGATDPLVTTGYTLTGLSSTANGIFQYIYVDRANSSFPDVTLRNSTTAPTWSNSFLGWYDGADRCIGAVWVQPAGTLLTFLCPEDDIYFLNSIFLLTSSTLDTTLNIWYSLDINAYTPVNTSGAYFGMDTFGSWTKCRVGITREATVTAYGNVQANGINAVTLSDWVRFERGADRKVRWMAYATSSSGTLWRFLNGYKIER